MDKLGDITRRHDCEEEEGDGLILSKILQYQAPFNLQNRGEAGQDIRSQAAMDRLLYK